MSETIPTFTGSIPENYDRYLVPVIFQPYADELARRVRVPANGRVLELACGTGVVSKSLVAALPESVELVLTDFSGAMLSYAQKAVSHASNVTWQEADACNLPFEDDSFDAVCCQFGFMFFPDKPKAAAQMRRVLKPGGRLAFSVWGALPEIPIFHALEMALQETFPEEERPIMPSPPNMGDSNGVRALIEGAGFSDVEVSEVTFAVPEFPPSHVASGFVLGTPLSKFFAEKGRSADEIHGIVTNYLKARFGDPIQTSMTAIVCEARA